MAKRYDAIVVGLGAMGSATAYHLARRGRSVLAFDQFTPPHARGSSHGETRIIREAYFEHPSYVPLLQRAYALWHELEHNAGDTLFVATGGLMLGTPDSAIVSGALRSAREHALRHEYLTAREVRSRFPALRPDDDMVAVLEPRAGVLFPERCVAAHLELARRGGAHLRCDERVLRYEAGADGVRVFTAQAHFDAATLIVTAGAWAARLLPDLKLPLQVERQVLYWFEPAAAAPFLPDRCPVHLWQFDGQHFFYGFPDMRGSAGAGTGVKVARHHDGVLVDPDTVDRAVSADEAAAMRSIVRRYLPGADGPLRQATVCVYTNTPDEHFWLDRHPAESQVLIASPCSGHGFKFASVIGEVLADLATTGQSAFDLGLFRART